MFWRKFDESGLRKVFMYFTDSRFFGTARRIHQGENPFFAQFRSPSAIQGKLKLRPLKNICELLICDRVSGNTGLVCMDAAGEFLKLGIGAEVVEEGIDVQKRSPERAAVDGGA